MLAAMLLAGTNAFAEAVEIDGIWYNLVSKAKVAEVTHKPNELGDYTGAVNIPDSVKYNNVSYSVTSIGEFAFSACDNLTSVTISNSVTSIGQEAFGYCPSLTSITIPESVTSIGDHAFIRCEGLTSVTIPNSVTSLGKSAFSSCYNLTSVTIGNGVKIISDYCFSYCTSLTSIAIPNSVTWIGYQAFYYCSGLTSINIPQSVRHIGNNAFEDCSGLTSINIPNASNIGREAFFNCSSLTSITLGYGEADINPRAFANCPELTDVYCFLYRYYIESDAFQGSYVEYATLHVPVAYVEANKMRKPWSDFGTIAPIYDEESSEPFPAGTYAKADLKRTFEEGWNTICLPFAIDNIEAAFGTGAKAYGFDDFADCELKFSQVTSLAAGTPYVIYVPAEITELIAFENIVVEESNTTSSNIDKNGACFRGTYAPVAAGEWTKNNSTDNIYGITPDGKIRKAGPEASILGLRGYFDIPAGTEVKGFVFEDGATGIKNLSNSPLKGEAIYNLAGQRLNKAQKGINIVNGKKVLY